MSQEEPFANEEACSSPLCQWEPEDLVGEEEDAIDPDYRHESQGDRVAAETEMRQRDDRERLVMDGRRDGMDARSSPVPDFFLQYHYWEVDPVEEMRRRDNKIRACLRDGNREEYYVADEEEVTGEAAQQIESIENLEDRKGFSTKEWVCMLAPKTEIYNRFRHVLRTTSTDTRGTNTYMSEIHRMCRANKATRSLPITVRHVDSVIRMAEAHARVHLRQQVLEQDVDVALGMLVESFVATQKRSDVERTRKAFRELLKKEDGKVL